MKRFACQSCEQPLFFENTHCDQCYAVLGYMPETATLAAMQPQDSGLWKTVHDCHDQPRAFCANHNYNVCNWLLAPFQHNGGFCFACQFNRVIPNLNIPGNMDRWRKLEVAKHRLFYTILRLKLPIKNRLQDPQNGLAFDFLDDPVDGSLPIMTGHNNGIITIATKEADDAHRERMRVEMGEYYRTLLGHFRHEIGHYYWNVLIRDGGHLEECRTIFGDDRADYALALKKHYARVPSGNWHEDYVSLYAMSHPWEDFAETWAHYFHIVSTLETALSYDMTIGPVADGQALLTHKSDPYLHMPFDQIISAWMPLTYAVNSLNRSMGLADFYPFVLTAGVRAKLRFVHNIVRNMQQTYAA
ncbi:zinc-binding metallopeptidase family protein [Acetobacter syzygii]|uniref:Zinc-ribbon domain-containing protein n=1 Tax=Acetobacter syzygii TaxID=146476 RepID=A0A270B7Y6_9PROT|nr:putative zinc-binding metallopeptidase [Acetobacter syzygii]PAL21133.1 hypothetical protein B9K05_11440 [Acetobacter syzygii]PAL23735.1 hypothetical protein B9K04_11405 [Acetobacter syzygii]GAN71072.1 hypothetical protein Absy_012_039 [Acetobacter syzygii]GBR64384.1 hypothetical protein AA0483_1335 [Acetobacter syzygii NRIC 0483]GEL57013.1 hypothetical protein ASY01nite_20790 [Acetobacter syzygii]